MTRRLLSAGKLASSRRRLEVVLQHTCTWTAAAAGSTDDPWGEQDTTAGTVTTGVPCLYQTRSRVQVDTGGTTLVNIPTLMVSATLGLAIGDTVSAITGSDSVVIAAGPFRVDRVFDDTAGLGAALLPSFELRGTQVRN